MTGHSDACENTIRWAEARGQLLAAPANSAGLPSSRRAMERLGLAYVAGADFEDVTVTPGDKLRPHVLYRIARPGEGPGGVAGPNSRSR